MNNNFFEETKNYFVRPDALVEEVRKENVINVITSPTKTEDNNVIDSIYYYG